MIALFMHGKRQIISTPLSRRANILQYSPFLVSLFLSWITFVSRCKQLEWANRGVLAGRSHGRTVSRRMRACLHHLATYCITHRARDRLPHFARVAILWLLAVLPILSKLLTKNPILLNGFSGWNWYIPMVMCQNVSTHWYFFYDVTSVRVSDQLHETRRW